MDRERRNSNHNSGRGSSKHPSPKNRNIVRDLLKESSLSSDDTEFMDLPLPPVPKTVEDMALNRRSVVVDVENLDVHPCVAAFLMSRMEYYIGLAPFFFIFFVPFIADCIHLLTFLGGVATDKAIICRQISFLGGHIVVVNDD